MRTVYIADANILIDLIDLGLGQRWTNHCRCLTTQEVFEEVEVDGDPTALAWLFDKNRVSIVDLSSEQISSAQGIRSNHPALSLPDCTVVILAQSKQLPVLSGDGPMRRKAAKLNIEVHGMLYILDQLVKLRGLEGRQAVDLCEKWREINPRTPTKLCHEYCRRWQLPQA